MSRREKPAPSRPEPVPDILAALASLLTKGLPS